MNCDWRKSIDILFNYSHNSVILVTLPKSEWKTTHHGGSVVACWTNRIAWIGLSLSRPIGTSGLECHTGPTWMRPYCPSKTCTKWSQKRLKRCLKNLDEKGKVSMCLWKGKLLVMEEREGRDDVPWQGRLVQQQDEEEHDLPPRRPHLPILAPCHLPPLPTKAKLTKLKACRRASREKQVRMLKLSTKKLTQLSPGN